MFVTGPERVLGDQVGFVEFGTEPFCRVHRSSFTSSGQDKFKVADRASKRAIASPAFP